MKVKGKINLFKLIFGKPFILSFSIPNKEYLFNIRDASDFSIFLEIFAAKVYPMEKTNKKIVIFDLGAHSGFFTVFAKMNCLNAEIYAFEPNPDNFSNLIKNLKLNGLDSDPKIKRCPGGLSDCEEEKMMYLDRKSSHHSIFPLKEPKEKIKICLENLKEFMKTNKINKVDIMKIDIEGGEYELLLNLGKKDFKKIKKILIEIHKIYSEKEKNALINHLRKYYQKVSNKGMVYYFE